MKTIVLGVACRKLLLWVSFPCIPNASLKEPGNFLLGMCEEFCPFCVLIVPPGCFSAWLLQVFPCSLLRSLPLLQGKSFPLLHFPSRSLSWISAAQWGRFVSGREKKLAGSVCRAVARAQKHEGVCINQEHTGSFSKPNLKGRSCRVWEEGGQFQRCLKQLETAHNKHMKPAHGIKKSKLSADVLQIIFN